MAIRRGGTWGRNENPKRTERRETRAAAEKAKPIATPQRSRWKGKKLKPGEAPFQLGEHLPQHLLLGHRDLL